jgi:hypothetical protein
MPIPIRRVHWAALVASTALITAPSLLAAQASNPSAIIPENATSLQGQPTIRVETTKDGAEQRTLEGKEAAAERLEISIVNNRFYWTSRNNRPLMLSTDGEFTYLMSDKPGQYVRLRRLNDRIAYVEHLDLGFANVTYWGELRVVIGP